MPDISILVRTADRNHKAEVVVSRDQTAAELIQGAVDNWKLPTDTDYSLSNVTKNLTLSPTQRLTEDVAADGDTLEVQPVLVAGTI